MRHQRRPRKVLQIQLGIEAMAKVKEKTDVPTRGNQRAPIDDKNSDPAFVAYYEKRSVSAGVEDRFRVVRDKMLRLRTRLGAKEGVLNVLNVGCGAGTECQIWAELGHHATGIDISQPLVELARKRASAKRL